MSKLPGSWKDVPVKKIINWLGHPANAIDDNDETALDRCKRMKELNAVPLHDIITIDDVDGDYEEKIDYIIELIQTEN